MLSPCSTKCFSVYLNGRRCFTGKCLTFTVLVCISSYSHTHTLTQTRTSAVHRAVVHRKVVCARKGVGVKRPIAVATCSITVMSQSQRFSIPLSLWPHSPPLWPWEDSIPHLSPGWLCFSLSTCLSINNFILSSISFFFLFFPPGLVLAVVLDFFRWGLLIWI